MMNYFRMFGNPAWRACIICRNKVPFKISSKSFPSLGSNCFSEVTFPARRFVVTHAGIENSFAVVLNKKNALSLMINRVQTDGFLLSNDVELLGSMIIFPHSLISWHVTHAQDVTKESLTLFKVLDPKIDILIFGFGSVKDYTPEVRKTFVEFCRDMKIRHEALPTEQAAGLFNFMAAEKRYVAAALIPPSSLPIKLEKSKTLSIEELEQEEEIEKIEEANKRLALPNNTTGLITSK